MQQDDTPRYDYTQAGFNAFLNRSIDSKTFPALSSGAGAPPSKQLAYDRGTTSGFIGDVLQIGNVQINSKGYIDITDEDGNVAVRIGDQEA